MSHGRSLIRRLVALAPGLVLLTTPSLSQQAEIPEHPKPGKALPPGFVSPEPPFEERIIWDDEKPGEPDFIPQALFDRYSLEELPLTERQRESLEASIRMSRPVEDPPPYPWWRPMAKCSSIQHDDGSPPGPNAVSYADLLLQHDAAVVGEVMAIVPGWDTGWDRVTRAIYFRVLDILRDRHEVLNKDQTIATTLVGGEITIAGVEVCTYESKDFRTKNVGDRWLILGQSTEEPSSFDIWLVLPIEEGQVLPQPIYRLKDREPIGLEDLKAQLAESESRDIEPSSGTCYCQALQPAGRLLRQRGHVGVLGSHWGIRCLLSQTCLAVKALQREAATAGEVQTVMERLRRRHDRPLTTPKAD